MTTRAPRERLPDWYDLAKPETVPESRSEYLEASPTAGYPEHRPGEEVPPPARSWALGDEARRQRQD